MLIVQKLNAEPIKKKLKPVKHINAKLIFSDFL